MNYRITPELIQSVLPEGFRPKLVNGYSIGGICLIRLEEIRPKGLPKLISISSENAAHRIAVEWVENNGTQREGVFIPRRDTDSRVNALAGGKIFPGVHHFSKFQVDDKNGAISLKVISSDLDRPLVDLQVNEQKAFPTTSVFNSLEESSDFFERGCVGYSSRPNSSVMDGLYLKASSWKVTPLETLSIHSAYFDDQFLFPSGSIEFDHALLMRDIVHEWHSEPQISAGIFH